MAAKHPKIPPKKNQPEKPAETAAHLTLQTKKSGKDKPDNSRKAVPPPANSSVPPVVLDSGGTDPSRPIGKNNPPKSRPEYQFKKGKSGNPKGYPKGRPNGSTIIKYWLSQSENTVNPISGKLERLTQLDIMTLKVISTVRKTGKSGEFAALLDRTEGKPVQSTKLLNVHDKKIEIEIGFKAPVSQPKPSNDEKK